MVGMLQIITYLLCVYLIYKGVEIFQVALMSNRANRTGGIVIGTLAIIISVIAAGAFIFMIDKQAASVSGIPRLP
jgi:uncharacterized membrane protein (DUF485 family)